jgi:phosphatidylglycerophosphatase A
LNADDDKTTLPRRVMTNPVSFLAFGLGAGLVPWAPGTWGSLLGVALAWLTLPLGLEMRFMVAIALIVSGLWLCGAAARRIGVHDHPGIVWDEIAAMYLLLLVAAPEMAAWAAAFLLYRLLDIWKPWPIRDLDHRLTGGPGIMLDDLVAALYAALLLGFGGWLFG